MFPLEILIFVGIETHALKGESLLFTKWNNKQSREIVNFSQFLITCLCLFKYSSNNLGYLAFSRLETEL